jgi:hypothetical protein
MITGGAALELFDLLCDLVCHRRMDSTWWSGGAPQPVCYRCFGIYAGLACASFVLWASRLRPALGWDALHGLFILSIVVLGLRLVPHGPGLSTLSGQLLGVAVVYLAVARRGQISGAAAAPVAPGNRPVEFGSEPPTVTHSDQSRGAHYVASTVACLVAIQLVCRVQAPWAASLSRAFVAGGMLVALSLCLWLVADAASVLRRRSTR